MKKRDNFIHKALVIFYGSYIVCTFVFVAAICCLTYIFGTSFQLAALLAISAALVLICVCSVNSRYLTKLEGSNFERTAFKSYGFILAFSFAVFCAFSFLPKPLWYCVAVILTLMLCVAGTEIMALISMMIEIVILVSFHAMGLQMLLSLFVLSCAIVVFFDKSKVGLNNKTLIFIILILQPLTAFTGNYPFMEQEWTDFIAMMVICEVVSYIFLLMTIRSAGKNITYWLKDKYLLLNDQTYSLIQELKLKNPGKYEESIHGVYFAERVARETGLDSGLVNAGMYYMYLGLLTDGNTDEEVIIIAKQHNFPEDMIKLLMECRHYPNKPQSAEATIVIITFVIIRAVLQWFAKNKEIKFNADKVIAPMCEKIYANGYLDNSKLSAQDWIRMKNVLISGGTYYEYIMRK